MGEFGFLGTWDDSWEILEEILKLGDTTVIPDLRYDMPEPFYLSEITDEWRSILKARRNTFLWSKAFSLFPPSMVRVERGENANKYYLDLSGAGPGLELTLPACYEKNETVNLAPGTLSYQRETFNPEAKTWDKPTAELRAGYDRIKRTIKRKLVLHEFHKRIWIGRHALALVERGEGVIHGFGIP